MALDINDVRKTQQRSKEVTLSQEAKEARDASGEMDNGAGVGNTLEITNRLAEIEKIIGNQALEWREVSKELKGVTRDTKKTIAAASDLNAFISGDKAAMQDAVLSGMEKARREASKIAKEEIAATAALAKEHILTLERESRERIDRLQRASAPGMLFNFFKWILLILLLVIAVTYLLRMYV